MRISCSAPASPRDVTSTSPAASDVERIGRIALADDGLAGRASTSSAARREALERRPAGGGEDAEPLEHGDPRLELASSRRRGWSSCGSAG